MALAGLFSGRPKPQYSKLQSNYDSAVNQNASDYDHIMQGYRALENNPGGNSDGFGSGMDSNTFTKLNPNLVGYLPDYSYNRGGDLGKTIGNLQETSKTGGFSDNDLYSLRERGISPIRAAYANAERNLSRQRSLSGGNMSNYGAVAAKMAREQAGQMGEAANRTNASIAEMVNAGKQHANSLLAPLLERENALKNETLNKNVSAKADVDARNAAEKSRVDAANAEIERMMAEFANRKADSNSQTRLNALQGQSSLYGTTPALTNTFGSQVLNNNAQNIQANQTANMLKQQRANLGLNLVNSQLRPTSLGRA